LMNWSAVISSVHFPVFILVMGSSPLFSKSINHKGHEGLLFNIPKLRVVQVRDTYFLLSC
jgi:hypothetical protein